MTGQRYLPHHRSGRLTRLRVLFVLAAATVALGSCAMHHASPEAVATRILSASVALALLVRGVVSVVHGSRRLRTGAVLAACLHLLGALVAGALALLALTLAFPVA